MCRDAIQFVHDQTVRLMNKGLTPRDIAARVKLPPHLATHPYLIEYYGTVEWSGTGCLTSAWFTGTPCTVRAVYHGYLGWFSGRAAELHPLPQHEEARRLVRLAGGRWVLTWGTCLDHIHHACRSNVVSAARAAVAEGEHQWGLQLLDMILDSEVQPG